MLTSCMCLHLRVALNSDLPSYAEVRRTHAEPSVGEESGEEEQAGQVEQAEQAEPSVGE